MFPARQRRVATVAEMGCVWQGGPEITLSSKQKNPKTKNFSQEVLLLIPGCTVHLMEEGEALELGKGEFKLVRILDKGASVATIIKVGNDLQWPLTKDEPVVKLGSLSYLFSLPLKKGGTLSYGVTFLEKYGSSLPSLDSFLRENSCFSVNTSAKGRNVDWKQFAPNIEDYSNVLAKAIAEGTGQIVKGIFTCSNSYCNLVHTGGEMIITGGAGEKNGVTAKETKGNKSTVATKKEEAGKSLKRVKDLSKMTENISKGMLDGVGGTAGSVMAPLVKSDAGRVFLATVPGEVLLASLDAINRILDAVEAAEKQTLSETSTVATRVVTDRYGESAGKAAEDVLATAGQCANTAWNIAKIRKAINPASSVSTGVTRNVGKQRK